MRAAFITLGCKVNQGETASLERLFEAAGWEVVPADGPADAYIVNSCTVTAAGEGKSRRWLSRLRRERPGAAIVLTGCMPQAFPEKALHADADVVTGTAQRGRLLANLERFMASGSRVVDIPGLAGPQAFEELAAGLLPGRTRAYLKIQDGCDGRCAYCIVPAARGPARSRARGAIVAEAAALAKAGCAELVLTGINLPSYGRDTGDDLAGVVQALDAVEGVRRIRLSSLDPHRITGSLIEGFARAEKLCRHFHLSLQSGCDATLARMRRPYTAARYRDAAQRLLEAMPGASLTTDVIVGFPGEDEDEFAQSLAFVREMGFLKVHVFPFSARPGTPAAGFDRQQPKAVKAERAETMQRAADEERRAFIARRLGQTRQVLLETPDGGGLFTGYTGCYIPVLAATPGAAQGEIAAVRLDAYDPARDAVLCSPAAD